MIAEIDSSDSYEIHYVVTWEKMKTMYHVRHVQLTDLEYERLTMLCRNEKEVKFWIKDLDDYLKNSPNKRKGGKNAYKSHYRVIRRRRAQNPET
jgi:hypothetical protein